MSSSSTTKAADIVLTAADTDAKKSGTAGSTVPAGRSELKRGASSGMFHRAPKAKGGGSTDDLHAKLDTSRFQKDPRLPDIKKEIEAMDLDGDGQLDQEEVATYILGKLDSKEEHRKTKKHARRLGRLLTAAAVVMFVFLGMNACLTAAVVYLSRETKIEASGTMLTKAGTLVEVGQQRTVLPLSSMLYLPRAYRNQLEHLTVKLEGPACRIQPTTLLPQ